MKSYNRDEVFKKTLEYFKGDDLATNVWINKYSLKDSDGNIFELTPNDMHKRIAKEIARIEKNYKNPLSEEEIFDVIKNFKYIIPQGGPMTGIGNNLQVVSLSNCFVIGNEEDSYGSIMKTDEEQVQLMKRRGGVGHDISHLRPNKTPVKNSAITSTGLVSFMDRYSNSTREVGQDGRRGALMLSCSIKHPDAEGFMDAKMVDGKVTGANISLKLDDDFMKSAISNGKYTQQYPIVSDNPILKKEVESTKLFNKIVHNAWKSAEPGILFWDTIIRESVPDCYSEFGFKTTSTNPCIVGDTLIATADGRNGVSIEQLTKESKDVPVYSLDDNGNICIKMMRNPRITAYNQKIYKVTIEGGHTFRVTGNHKFILKNNDEKNAKDLNHGDSLKMMTKYKNKYKKNKYYNLRCSKSVIGEHRLIAEFNRGDKLLENEVVHHKDYIGLNNNPNNLQIMTKQEHDYLHSIDMLGDKNPYHKMTDKWKKEFASHPGESNGKYIYIDNKELLELCTNLTKKYKRKLSRKEWENYAKINKLPLSFSNYRSDIFGSITNFLKYCAELCGFEHIDKDPRLVETYLNMKEQGYNTKIINNIVLIEKTCETCDENFWVEHRKREYSFCSVKCSTINLNNSKEIKENRTNSINETYSNKSENTKENQLKIYSDLKFYFDREPKLIEWEKSCKENSVPFRLKTKYGFDNYSELKKESEYYNHKVISVEEDGFENVYNGTVDDTHKYFLTDKSFKINVLTQNCGEIPLCPYDSCRLLALNLYSYVENKFTKNAKFNFDLFKKHAKISQRIMDDIIDLELEKIDQILEKIENDPEQDRIKLTEKELWTNIQDKALKGRRTGIGVTAEGDMLAALGYRYGTKEATNFSTEVHKVLAINVYKSSCLLSKERGTFDIFDSELEKNNPLIKRLSESDEELAQLLKEGRRNIALLTIAPTGTVSLMTQTTSGVEPAFRVAYKRRRKINPNDKDARIDFTDTNGDCWEEYSMFHPKFLKWLKVKNYDIEEVKLYTEEELQKLVEKSPYYKATSNDVDWVEKVKMQGSLQKWVDHSISVTVNLPENIKEEIVAEVYKTAWESGCKGITVYRDGCRDGVLISDSKKDKSVDDIIKENDAPRRPKKIECDILRFQNNRRKWIGFVGLLDGYPYEVFTGNLDNFQVPTFVDRGWIVKEKDKRTGKSRYDLHYTDKDGYEQEMRGLSRAFDREYWNTGKLISGILRHGMPIPNALNLIDTLDLDGDTITSWKSGVKRMLKKYIKDDTIAKGQVCPNCGNENLKFTEGCLLCQDCGWSKCG